MCAALTSHQRSQPVPRQSHTMLPASKHRSGKHICVTGYGYQYHGRVLLHGSSIKGEKGCVGGVCGVCGWSTPSSVSLSFGVCGQWPMPLFRHCTFTNILSRLCFSRFSVCGSFNVTRHSNSNATYVTITQL